MGYSEGRPVLAAGRSHPGGTVLDTDLLVVGAGPFGLALAAEARRQGLHTTVVGRPMSFWRDHMPDGMVLRSASDWHLDVAGEATIEAFLAGRGTTPAAAEPLTRRLYLEYVEWFSAQKQLDPLPVHVTRLDRDGSAGLRATLADGSTVTARSVALALGMGAHPRVPDEIAALLPVGSWRHSRDAVDLSSATGRRYLLVGGRQSAFEWAALLAEGGAAAVDVVHRHDTPAFAAADWSWTGPIVARMVDDPGWFARLSPVEKDVLRARLWAEGRLKLEPWLADRLPPDVVRVRSGTAPVAAHRLPDGSVEVQLADGVRLAVDEVVLCTGYLPRLADLDLVTVGDLPPLADDHGCPALDDGFQTSVPGLYATSFLATQHFGPFFGFTLAARMAAAVLTRAVVTTTSGAARPSASG